MLKATRWNDRQFSASLEEQVWTASPVVRRYLHLLATGDPNCDWLTYVCYHHLPRKVERTLVLGCGSGWLERALAQKGPFGSILACDFARDTVERARHQAEAEGLAGIEYRVLDLEHDELPPGPFGAVFAHDVLHHITDLERLYPLIHDALAPEGRFLFNEYVGPNRFQYSDERVELIDRCFQFLPPRLRQDPFSDRILWVRGRTDLAQLVEDDPTEAVRSEEVLPLARRVFDPVAEYPYGGGILNRLLYEVIRNFRPGDPCDDLILQSLCDEELRLTKSGKLESDFWIFVGKRRDSPNP